MSPKTSKFVVHKNGRAATVDDLSELAFAGYAHFTAMQVRGGRIRGLDLHLDRLRAASLELFGHALEDDRILGFLRTAIGAGAPDLSLTVTVYPSTGEFVAAATDTEPRVLIRTTQPSSGPEGPLALAVVRHERFLPQVKQTGEAAKTYFLRETRHEAFNDVAFVDRYDRLSEASIWNLAFWDGESVAWPDADLLVGTTMGILRRQLDRLGVTQRRRTVTLDDLEQLAGAVVMNSWTPGVAVTRIGTRTVPYAPAFLDLLHEAFRAEPAIAP